ncbi:HIT family hydrolase [Campylobacter sp. MIT 99-7217]|uniref:HIT family protein n=1 Tax=Campylobacter sp. MIT 99-7217 TaxID=535091 RepID=UPI001159B78E|nr:HIT domain-containing protein [Campylobacter sp. MIT 99-7217]TQR34541.1 HIT family hydrolase [Campylobacter sp. MIT 99-7217]
MQYLYAPWRSQYFSKEKDICPFCLDQRNLSNEEMGVIFRAKFCFGIMNAYPYSPAHFMVVPYLHEENIENLDPQTWQEMSKYVQKGVQILKEQVHAKGVNIGMNLGEQAGAGIAKHCHYHLVPRWFGDTNFITTIADTRVCGRDLNEIYKKLCFAFGDL